MKSIVLIWSRWMTGTIGDRRGGSETGRMVGDKDAGLIAENTGGVTACRYDNPFILLFKEWEELAPTATSLLRLSFVDADRRLESVAPPRLSFLFELHDRPLTSRFAFFSSPRNFIS